MFLEAMFGPDTKAAQNSGTVQSVSAKILIGMGIGAIWGHGVK
jgi:hypothetical protein